MTRKPKFGKIAIVVFLTVLIWVWADLAQDARLSLSGLVTITVAQTSDPSIWIMFKDETGTLKRSVSLDSVDLKGPASRVTEVERMKNKGTLDLALFLDPKQAGLETEGSHVLDVLSLLQQNDQVRQLGLTVESSEPRTLTVQVQRLVEKRVALQCVDANGLPISAEMDPTEVTAYVAGDEVRTAKIRLSAAEQQQAKTSAIQKTPFVELAPGQTRDVPVRVKVKLPSEEATLTEYPIQATLGFCFSPNLQGKYRVELQNETDFANVFIRATPRAKAEFEKQDFDIILYILDNDKDKPPTEFQEREVVFNFPKEYVLRGEIKEGHTLPPKARFRVVPVSPDGKPAATK